MNAGTDIATRASRFAPREAPTTDGTIALLNLEGQIEGLKTEVTCGHSNVADLVALIDLFTLRGLILGRVADYEHAEELAERLVRSAADGTALTARARTRATLHRFKDALGDLNLAEQFSPQSEEVPAQRAAILQALGRYDEALAIRQIAADRRASFETLGALAGLYAERGDVRSAERLFVESRSRYRGVSPFPLAILDFQQGLMWMAQGALEDARTCFDAARHRIPAYAAAQGHLAEVEAELGAVDIAIDRLRSLAATSDDPDYAAQLARILSEVGRPDESQIWRQRAAARYEELVAMHPEAFADHAAEFWLAAGADANKALRLAEVNLKVRKTPRAYDLVSRALIASYADSPPPRTAL